ncbi:MAG: HPF/RaiA family ribosome-associated protein [Acidobacteria bacterium]|nr:HPF/RaiA family ribosome-associated protein [Acidobacteriota bacterium]
MKVTYTGRKEALYPTQNKKLQDRFAKVGKLLDGRRGEKNAHVILEFHRNRHKAEITVNYLDHMLVGVGSDPDQFNAITVAIDKIEKQVLRIREKRRDMKEAHKLVFNVKDAEKQGLPPAGPQPGERAVREVRGVNGRPEVFYVTAHGDRKPMTVEEALMEIGRDGNYLVYTDAATDRLSVLLRRRDGNFDLIET